MSPCLLGIWRVEPRDQASVLQAGGDEPAVPVPGALPPVPLLPAPSGPMDGPSPTRGSARQARVVGNLLLGFNSWPLPRCPPDLHLLSGSRSWLTQPSEQVADNHRDTGAIGLF